MTVEEAREILARFADTPTHQMSEEELRDYQQASRVVEAAQLSGEDIFGALRDVADVQRRAFGAVGEVLEGVAEQEQRALRAGGRAVTGGLRAREEGQDIQDEAIRSEVASAHFDLQIAKQKLNVHNRATNIQEETERVGGEPEQILPTAEAARDIAQQQLDRASVTRQQREAQQARQEAETRGALVGVQQQLPEGFTAERDITFPVDTDPVGGVAGGGFIEGEARTRQEDVRARYREMDVLEFSGKSQEEIISQQQKLVRAGLLEEGEYWPGWWGSKSQNAYRTALGVANESGKDVDSVIYGMQRARRGEDDDATASRIAEIRSRAFTPPDYRTLAQTTKEHAEQRLGRDMKDYEVQLMADELKQSFRAQHETQIEAGVASVRAQEEADEVGEPVSAGEVSGPTTRADVMNRFRAAFEERFGKELEHKEEVEEKQANHQLLMQSLRGMDRLVG